MKRTTRRCISGEDRSRFLASFDQRCNGRPQMKKSIPWLPRLSLSFEGKLILPACLRRAFCFRSLYLSRKFLRDVINYSTGIYDWNLMIEWKDFPQWAISIIEENVYISYRESIVSYVEKKTGNFPFSSITKSRLLYLIFIVRYPQIKFRYRIGLEKAISCI